MTEKNRERNRLVETITQFWSAKQNKTEYIAGLLGAYINGEQTVDVPNRPGWVYVRIGGVSGEIVQAYNSVVSPLYDLKVILIKDELSDYYRIFGFDSRQYSSFSTDNPLLAAHAPTHSFGDGPDAGIDPVFIYKKQLLQPLGTVPFDTSGTVYYVNPDFYNWNNNINWFPGGNTVNLNQYKPTGANNNRFVTIYLTGGQLAYALGDEFEASPYLTSTIDYIPEVSPLTGIQLAAALLNTGTTTADWDDLFDIRSFLSAGFVITGSSSGGSTGTVGSGEDHYFARWLGGVLTGTNVYYHSGSIGINTTTPSETLEVRGNAFISGTLKVRNLDINSLNSSTQLNIKLTNKRSGGSIGSTDNARIHLSNAVYDNTVGWLPHGSSAQIVDLEPTTGNINFFSDTGLATGSVYSPKTRVIINSSGVGIGTSVMNHNLNVSGTASISRFAIIGTNTHVGSGTNKLALVDTTSKTQLYLTNLATGGAGGYIASTQPDQLLLSAGIEWDGSTWRSRSTEYNIIDMKDGNFDFYNGVNATPGASITPRMIGRWYANGRLVLGVSDVLDTISDKLAISGNAQFYGYIASRSAYPYGNRISLWAQASQSNLSAYDDTLNNYSFMVIDGSQISIRPSGTETVRISNMGVGINNSAPAYPLSVAVNNATQISFYRADNTPADSGGYLISNVRGQAVLANAPFLTGSGWNSVSSGTAYVNLNPNGDISIGTTGFHTIGSVVSPPVRMFIQGTNGRVGIGTSTPAALLDVNGDARISGSVLVGSFDTTPPALPGGIFTRSGDGPHFRIRPYLSGVTVQFWRDDTPTVALAVGNAIPSQNQQNAYVTSYFSGSVWTEISRIDNVGLRLSGITSSGALQMRQLTVSSGTQTQLLNVTGDGGGTLGLAMIFSPSENTTAMFALRGAGDATNELFDPSSVYSNASGTSNSTNIYWDGTKYAIQNRRSDSRTYSIFLFTNG